MQSMHKSAVPLVESKSKSDKSGTRPDISKEGEASSAYALLG